MIKKLKIGLLIVALSFVGAISAYASNDVNYANDTTFMVSGRPYIITAGSKASTVVVDSGTIVVTMSSAGPLTLESLYGDTLTNNGSLAITCSGATSLVTVPANTATVTFTPTAPSVCNNAPIGGGGLSSGGGGGLSSGGGSYTPPVVTTTTTTTPATVSVSPTVTTTQVALPAGCSSPAGFSITTGMSCGTVTITTTTPSVIAGCNGTVGFSTLSGVSCAGNTSSTTTTSYNFGTVTLKLGSRGAAVVELQRFLNNKLMLGLKLDGILGAKTIAVIKTWQKNHGLVADGLIGAKTKAMMQTSAETGGN